MGSVANLSSTPYGRRLLPTLIDEVSSQDPDRECFQVPRSAKPSDGWRVLTWKDMANAVNRCAHKITELCGTPEKDIFPTIAYIGPNDVRYIVLMVAAVKAGYTALFISPRNSKEGQLNLFDQTGCNILAFPGSHRETVQPWLAGREMQAVEVSPLDAWFPGEQVPHFPYTKTFDEAEWDPFLILHTSGSTGLPKPIVVRQGMWCVNDGYHNLPLWEGKNVALREWADRSRRQFIPMPLFHIAGIICVVCMSMFWDTPVCLGIAERPLSSDLVIECLDELDVQSTLLPPAVIEDLSRSEEGLQALARLNVVAFGGGNLAREAGNRVARQGAALMNLIGATEFAPFPTYARGDPALWQYFIYNPEAMGCEFRKLGGDEDVYEMVVMRQEQNQHPHPGLQGVFYTFPKLDEWSTRDLYRPHPTEPHHWIYHGRSDNIIVFSSGEKLNPVTIEEIVGDHPGLKGAMVVGAERFQPGLILEPRAHPETKEEEKTLLERVWPLVEKANEETVSHGRVSRDMIRLSKPEKPFSRAGKGTVQRAATVKLYKDEIDELYEGPGAGGDAEEVVELDLESEESLARSIVTILGKYVAAERLNVDVDFFAAGIDSMGVIKASKLLRAGLEGAGREVDDKSVAARVIYQNPTPRRLAAHILGNILNGKGHEASGDEQQQQQQQQAMHAIWKKYTRNLTKARPNRPDPSNENQTVILTGSTGMLGSYLLDLMLRNPRVAKVICLNRASDGGRAQQARAFADRGLDTGALLPATGRAEFHRADLSRPGLGLPGAVYARLQAEADRVVHNAWPVNFNMPVESFEPSLAGVRHVADLAASAARRVAVTFVSSIAAADRWDPAARGGRRVPERRLADLALPGGGYGRSKAVGSLIVEDAAGPAAGDFPWAVVRVGQVAGPEADAGAWSPHEWLPSIVASSLYLGALPAGLGPMSRVDWTPAERVAALVLEAAGVSGVGGGADDISGYYHGVNPHGADWADLAAAVREFYGAGRIRELVGFGEWVDRLEGTLADGPESAARNPGVKLIDSYRDMARAPGPVVFDMERTLERCQAARETGAVTPDMMKHWCRQWGF